MSVPASSSPLEIGRTPPLMWTSSSPTLWRTGSNSSVGFPLSSGSAESCVELKELKVRNLHTKSEAQKKALDELPPGLQSLAKSQNFDRFFDQLTSQPESLLVAANFLVHWEHFNQLARLFRSLDKSIQPQIEDHVLKELEKLPEEERVLGLTALLVYYQIVASSFSETHENDLKLEKDTLGQSGRLRRLTDIYNRLVCNHTLLKRKVSVNTSLLSERASAGIPESTLASVARKINWEIDHLTAQVAGYDKETRELARYQADFTSHVRGFELAFDSFVYYFQKYIRKCQGHSEEERLTFKDKLGPFTFRLVALEFQRDLERWSSYLQNQKDGIYLDTFGHQFNESFSVPESPGLFAGVPEELKLLNDQMRDLRLKTQASNYTPNLPALVTQLNTFILMRALLYLNIEKLHKELRGVEETLKQMASQPALTTIEAHRISCRLGLSLKTIKERELINQERYQKDIKFYDTHRASWEAFQREYATNYQEIVYLIDTYMNGGRDPRSSALYRTTSTLTTHKKIKQIPQEIDLLTLERSLK